MPSIIACECCEDSLSIVGGASGAAVQALVCATWNAQQPEKTPTQEYYNSLLKLQSDLDNGIAEQAGAGTGTDSASKLLKDLTLLAAMVGHSFDPTFILTIPSDIECPFCRHLSLNTVAEDHGMVPQNNAIYADYGVLISKWEQYKTDVLVANNNGDPKPAFPTNRFKKNSNMKRHPPAPSLKSLDRERHICTCLNSKCVTKGSDIGSTCPIKCCEQPEGD
jgi:hypothetical protein